MRDDEGTRYTGAKRRSLAPLVQAIALKSCIVDCQPARSYMFKVPNRYNIFCLIRRFIDLRNFMPIYFLLARDLEHHALINVLNVTRWNCPYLKTLAHSHIQPFTSRVVSHLNAMLTKKGKEKK